MAELSTLGSTIKPTYESEADTNAFTNAEKALLANQSGTNTGDESAASDITSGVVELATIAEVDTGTDTVRAITPAGLTGSALQSKVNGIESGANVTNTASVTAAGALMASEVDADLKTFSLPANTTISAFGATLVDDADAATARATLGVGTGSGDVTKVGTPANNQVGVWTGDGTLEGTAALTFGGAALGITGDISVSGTVDGRDVAADGSKLDGIESNATADQSSAEIKSAYEANADTNAFTDSEQTLLGNQSGVNTGDEAEASETVSGVVELATIAEVDTGTDTVRAITPAGLAGSALQSKLDGIEAGANVTNTASVTASGALMDSEVDADIKTLSLPASTTISVFGATLVDDADAATARATLGVGTGSGDVTKVGTPVNNQVGVWTGDGTLEGTAGLTFDGAALDITGNIAVSGTVDGRDVATDGSKLDTIESSATADQSNAEIKSAYEANANTNAFTDAEQTLLGNQSGTNTGDESAASATVSGVVELATISEVDTGTDTVRAITPAGLAGSALQSKVNGIESGANVTDTANVTAAGALMDSEVDADLKTFALPANTTISAFGATLVDDADAATARATLDAGPKYPSISAVTISASAIATELNGSNYTLVLSEDVDSGWTAAIPSGGTPTTRTYYATLRISPPAAGGPFAISIPAGWERFGGLSTISLSSTDAPILVYLRSNGPVGIDFTAAQAS